MIKILAVSFDFAGMSFSRAVAEGGSFVKACPYCAEAIQDEAIKCRFCGEAVETAAAKWIAYRRRFAAMSPEEQASTVLTLTPEQMSRLDPSGHVPSLIPEAPKPFDWSMFALGVLLGPLGFWLRKRWMAGFAWLGGAFILAILIVGSGGLLFILVPLLWVGMGVHLARLEQ